MEIVVILAMLNTHTFRNQLGANMEAKTPEQDNRGEARNKLNKIDKIITVIVIAIFVIVLAFMFVFYAFT